MNNLGFGVARDNGKVVFVQHGIDGDTARVKIIKCTSGYDVARIEELLVPSPHRAESNCAVSGRCGGCIYRGITREHELELKKKTVESAFRRAGLSDVRIGEVQSTEAATGYRNKLQLPVGVSKDGRTVMGYYAAHSHDIIPCENCLLHPDEMNKIASFVREYIAEANWSAVRHLYMRSGTKPDGENNITVCLIVRKRPNGIEAFADRLTAEFPAVSGVLLNYNPEDTNVILGDRFELISGVDYTCDRLCGIDFRISPASFYQVNHDAAELAYRLIAEKAELSPGDRLLDLYCGIGTIGLCTAAQVDGVSLTGIEIIPSAVENARENAARGGFTVVSPEEIKMPAKDASEKRACFICGDAGDAGAGDYDVIIVDPPRKGCSAELIDKLAEFMRGGASRLVYMSCNPSTLARDVGMLLERGLKINGDVTTIDMFPGTGHVEAIICFNK